MIYFKNNSVTFDLHLTRSILEPPPWERIPQILVSIRLFLFCAPNCAELTCCVYLFKRLVNSWRRYYILFTFVSRDITLPTKVRLVKAMVFPVVMWELDCEESWAPKNWLIWKDWCWERLKAGGEGYDRGWDGWMASPIQWTWVWINSWSWR